jgi:multiple sugar transport system substrate-binding protein
MKGVGCEMGLFKIVSFMMMTMMFINGCSSQTIIDNRHQLSDFEEEMKQEIVIWHTYSEEETDVFENIVVPLFEEEYPMINVKPVRQPYNEQLKSAIISRASANKPPDVIRMDIAWLPTFAELDLLYPLNQFGGFQEVVDFLYSEPLQSNLYEGTYYGLPLNTTTKVAIYNRSLLRKAGYDAPPSTMDDLVKLVKDHGLVIGLSGVSPWETLPYFYGFGGKLTDSSFTKASGYLNGEDSILAVKKIVDLVENHYINSSIVTGNAGTWQGVLDERYVMIDEGPWYFSIHKDDVLEFIKEQTVLAPFPVTDGKGSVLGGENLVMTKGTKHPEAAWTFIKWMTTQTPQQLMFEAGLIPTNKHVELGNVIEKYPYYQTYVDSIQDAFLRPPVAGWSRIEEIYLRYFKLILSGSITVEEGLNKAAEEIDLVLLKEKGS